MPESNRGVQLERLILLIREISASRHGITTRELAEIAGVDVRTIQRDIGAIMLDLPLTMEKRGKEIYYFFSYKLDLPADLLSLDEVVALLALVESTPHWKGTSLGRSIESVLSKLRQLIPPSEMNFLRKREQPLMVQSRGFVEYERDWLELFSEAVDDEARIRLAYRSLGDGKIKRWSADPLCVLEHDQAFYAVVGVPKYKTVRIIALSRVHSAERSGKSFDARAYDFRTESLMRDSFGIWIGEPTKVRVQFFDWSAVYVAERIWHPQQRIERMDDGSIIVEFESGSIPEISRWVMSFGSTARAIEPEELITLITSELKKSAQLYGQKQ
ncbi:MAG TPA: WYL domain-containing protein [candidate division Zixibacteria bacterium]|nr:WYL domain-containing protein [candidate division Zixibacteria bacterium]